MGATNVDGLVASYNIAKQIAECGKPHSVGESLVLPAIAEVLSNVLHQEPSMTIKRVPLSNDSKSVSKLMKVRYAEIKLYFWGTCISSTKMKYEKDYFLLWIYRQIPKGKTIFDSAKDYFDKKSVPLKTIVACATDGARAMTGQHRGFVTLLKREVPHVFTVHCIIHRQHLAAKKLSEALNHSLQVVTDAVNYIKRHAVNERLLRQLCKENEDEFLQLLLHTEVRWLSKGKRLNRFHELFDSISEFLHRNNENLCMKAETVKHNCAYLADIFDKCNSLIMQIQGDNVSFIKARSAVTSFIVKLDLFHRNISRREFYQFPSLNNIAEDVTNDQSLTYSAHVRALQDDMKIRFADLIKMEIPIWLTDPFISCTEDMVICLREELRELQNDTAVKIRFSQMVSPFFGFRMPPNVVSR
ncbi:protein FAM200C-like [Chiloscyllium punctatum]|uniref:protein FAM200C-like n=1 Tax=Chiloscyllium punctatum TaxID=137246 RepID=UPI003B636AAA